MSSPDAANNNLALFDLYDVSQVFDMLDSGSLKWRYVVSCLYLADSTTCTRFTVEFNKRVFSYIKGSVYFDDLKRFSEYQSRPTDDPIFGGTPDG